MKDYSELAKKLVQLIGGKENILAVEHCMTRLRFQLKDNTMADTEAIKGLKQVITVRDANGQYQVVIGNKVGDVYKDLCNVLGLQESHKQEEQKKMSPGEFMIDFMSGIIMSILSLMTASGILKGLLVLARTSGVMSGDSGTYILFNAISDALFLFLPIFLGYNTAKKIGVTPHLGMLMGAILCYPAINGVDLQFLGQTLNATYTSSFLPVIFMIALAKPLEAFLKKVLPDVIKSFVTPLLVLMIIMPIGFALVGPLANRISLLISDGLTGLYSVSPILMGVIVGALWQVLVIFGIHGILISVSMFNIFNGGGDMVLAVSVFATFAQTAAVLAIAAKTKDKKLRQLAIPAAVSGIFGITEPAIYGITLPRIKTFVASCVGGAVAGFFTGMFGILKYAPGGGIFGVPTLLNTENPQIFPIFITALAGMTVSFLLTLIVYKDDAYLDKTNEIADTDLYKGEEIFVRAPLSGSIKNLSECTDKAFSEGGMGKGLVIEPKEGVAKAPFDGIVEVLFPTGHAIGLTSDQGCEVLIHIGIDTVELEGKHFDVLVKQGDRVKQGQPLVRFNRDAIEKEGFSLETPIIVTNADSYTSVDYTTKQKVILADTIMTVR